MALRASYIFILIIPVAIGSLAGARPDGSDDEKFRPDAEKLKLIDRAAEQWNTVNRWLIEYEATPSAKTRRSVPVHRIIAVSAPGELYHLNAHFPPTHPWQADPYCQEYFIHQGTTCHRWPFSRIYSEGRRKPGDDLGGTIAADVLLTVIPRWPLTDYTMPVDARSGTPIIPFEALRSADYRLLSDSESLAGEDCVVFDRKGMDRIWIATKKGLCVMQRTIRDPRSGRLLQRILAEKVDQAAPGLWLPTEFCNQIFSISKGTNEDIIERESKVRILRCVLNENVPESTFTPAHRPGSLRYDNSGQFTQVSAGGEDLLSDIVNFMVKYGHLPTKPVPRHHAFLWLLGGLAGGVCAGFFHFPIRKRRLTKAEVDNTAVGVSGPKL